MCTNRVVNTLFDNKQYITRCQFLYFKRRSLVCKVNIWLKHIMSEDSSKDLKDESSLSSNDVTLEVRKLQRRSSIFKLSQNGSLINYSFNESKLENGTDLMSNHEKMKHEILKWKSTYVEIKNDYKNYKRSERKDTCLEDSFAKEHIIFENYITKANSFIFHVNNAVEMYKHITQYEDLQFKRMDHMHRRLQKKIKEKLNL